MPITGRAGLFCFPSVTPDDQTKPLALQVWLKTLEVAVEPLRDGAAHTNPQAQSSSFIAAACLERFPRQGHQHPAGFHRTCAHQPMQLG
ncbi:hypothetical protein [Comamonas sp.]|uniref:hypothetical protein n=1 Tax=Comamonas sp. TaxID=34028 RepID=UPI0028A1C235|nr:hypothetical protein [Comamonas sp.]